MKRIIHYDQVGFILNTRLIQHTIINIHYINRIKGENPQMITSIDAEPPGKTQNPFTVKSHQNRKKENLLSMIKVISENPQLTYQWQQTECFPPKIMNKTIMLLPLLFATLLEVLARPTRQVK